MPWNHETAHTHDEATLKITNAGGAHPDLATHDALGLATDAELATHAGDTNTHVYFALDADLANHEADTTAIHGIANTASLVLTSDSRLHTHVWNEHPTGTVDGNNAAFVLASAPASGSLLLFRNGLLMQAGGNDYALNGSTVTFVAGNFPQPGDVLLASYIT